MITMGESMQKVIEQLRQPLRPLQPPLLAPGTLAEYINGYDKI